MQLDATTPSSGNVPPERRSLPVVSWSAPTGPSGDAFVLAGAGGVSDGAPANEDLELHVVDDVTERTVGHRVEEVMQPGGRVESTFKVWQTRALQLTETSEPRTRVHLAALYTEPGWPFVNRLKVSFERFPAVAGLIAVSA